MHSVLVEPQTEKQDAQPPITLEPAIPKHGPFSTIIYLAAHGLAFAALAGMWFFCRDGVWANRSRGVT